MPKWMTQILAPLICGVLLLLGVVALNSLLRGHFHENQRCKIAFSDIDVVPPGKLSREEFLAEVQYLANWPDEINLLDDGLPARLHLSFAAHPWVEAVELVRIEPPRQVHVRLRYRVPVLSIPPNGVVDQNGILLPQAAADPQLPVLDGKIAPPTGHTGQPWGDIGVMRAAAVSARLAPYQEQLPFKHLEIVDGILILKGDRTRVTWGKVESNDQANDPTDATKVQRLFDIREEFGSFAGHDVDLRLR